MRLQATDNTWFDLRPYFKPIELFSYERDMSVERNDGSEEQFLFGDRGISPAWIELQGRRYFSDDAERRQYLSALRHTLENIAAFEYNDITIQLEFGYLDVRADEDQPNLEMTIRLAPSATRFNGSDIILWGSVDYFLGDMTVHLGDS